MRCSYFRRLPFLNGLRPLGLGGIASDVRVPCSRPRAFSYALKTGLDARTFPFSMYDRVCLVSGFGSTSIAIFAKLSLGLVDSLLLRSFFPNARSSGRTIIVSSFLLFLEGA